MPICSNQNDLFLISKVSNDAQKAWLVRHSLMKSKRRDCLYQFRLFKTEMTAKSIID